MLAFIGSAAALLLAGLAFIVSRHRHHLPGMRGSAWALTASICLMLLAGTEVAYAGAGTWLTAALLWVKGLLGSAGPTVFALLALLLAVTTAVALFRRPSERAMWVAFALPVVCATFSFGVFHQINVALGPVAQQVTAALGSLLGV